MSSVSKAVGENLQRASWIRKMFEEGARMKAERGSDKVFDFTLGNPEVEPPQALIDTVKTLVASDQRGLHSYMPNAGYPRTRAVVAQLMSKATGLDYTENHVLMTVGAGGALNALLKALLDPGDEVIVLAPYFVEYGFYVGNHGGRIVLVDTDEDFGINVERIAAVITPRTKAIIINSPNNPTGVIYSEASLCRLGDLLESLEQPVTVISDEPYKALTFDGVKAPELPKCIRRTVIATSWSKALAIPGERIGYLAISPKIPEARQIFDACTFTNRTLGFVNAPALWQNVIAEVAELTIDITPYQEKRDIFYDGLTTIGYDVVKPHGAFYLFPKTPIADDIEFAGLLKEEGILTVPGTGFGRKGHVRVTLTVPRDTIERSLPGFERVFRKVSA